MDRKQEFLEKISRKYNGDKNILTIAEDIWKEATVDMESIIQRCEYYDSQVEFAKRQQLTNKEFRDILSQHPDNALICVECCHPRLMKYDEKNNLIRID